MDVHDLLVPYQSSADIREFLSATVNIGYLVLHALLPLCYNCRHLTLT